MNSTTTTLDIEIHPDGLPIFRGWLARLISNRPGEAYLHIPCPQHGYHIHGWTISGDASRIEHRGSHCPALHPVAYHIGLDPLADHAIQLNGGR